MGRISMIIRRSGAKGGAFALLALAAACAVAPGNVFHTMYGTQVHALADGRFEVVPEIGATRDAFWCAAGEYARRARGAGWTRQVYVARGMGAGEAVDRRSTVVFTLDPVASAEPRPWLYRANRFQPGDSLSVQSAEARCSLPPRHFFRGR